jgi:hypothetical protein
MALHPAQLSALKAPPHASPGQRPGFRNQPIAVRPERAQESSALSGRATISGHDTRGVAPGWYSPRRWRDDVAVFSSGENCQNASYKITCSDCD